MPLRLTCQAEALCQTHSMEENDEHPGRAEFLRVLRAAALVAALAGAAGSLGLLFHASHSRPPLLMVLFVIWVSSPFLAGVFASMVSKRWSVLTQATLYVAMLVVALGALAVYGNDALRPRRAQAAFVYIAVPLGSWLIATVIPIAAFVSRRQSRRVDGV